MYTNVQLQLGDFRQEAAVQVEQSNSKLVTRKLAVGVSSIQLQSSR